MSEEQKELAKVIEKYFGADAGYLDIDCFTLARRIIEAGWIKPIRCKDCEYYEGDECGNPYILIFCAEQEMYTAHLYTDPDDFCSYGKRRD